MRVASSFTTRTASKPGRFERAQFKRVPLATAVDGSLDARRPGELRLRRCGVSHGPMLPV